VTDLIIINLKTIENTEKEIANKDINIEEVITYLKRKNPCFVIDKYKPRQDSKSKLKRLRSILCLY